MRTRLLHNILLIVYHSDRLDMACQDTYRYRYPGSRTSRGSNNYPALPHFRRYSDTLPPRKIGHRCTHPRSCGIHRRRSGVLLPLFPRKRWVCDQVQLTVRKALQVPLQINKILLYLSYKQHRLTLLTNCKDINLIFFFAPAALFVPFPYIKLKRNLKTLRCNTTFSFRPSSS